MLCSHSMIYFPLAPWRQSAIPEPCLHCSDPMAVGFPIISSPLVQLSCPWCLSTPWGNPSSSQNWIVFTKQDAPGVSKSIWLLYFCPSGSHAIRLSSCSVITSESLSSQPRTWTEITYVFFLQKLHQQVFFLWTDPIQVHVLIVMFKTHWDYATSQATVQFTEAISHQ